MRFRYALVTGMVLAMAGVVNKIGYGKDEKELRYVLFPCEGVRVGCYLDETGNFYHCQAHWPLNKGLTHKTAGKPPIHLIREAQRLLGLPEE